MTYRNIICYKKWQTYFWHYIRPLLALLYSIIFLLAIITIILILNSPQDYQQKLSVKIMYIHVPCAWLALFCYSFMTVAALFHLYKKTNFTQYFLKNSAPLGAMFTFLAMFSGALWGQLSWGSWWEWDARLTSVFILLFLYILIISLGNAFRDEKRAANAQAILTLFGSINLPIIKFSVNWWYSLHQPSSLFTKNGPAIDKAMLWPLIFAMLTVTLLFCTFLTHRLYYSFLNKRVCSLKRKKLKNKKLSLKENNATPPYR